MIPRGVLLGLVVSLGMVIVSLTIMTGAYVILLTLYSLNDFIGNWSVLVAVCVGWIYMMVLYKIVYRFAYVPVRDRWGEDL